MPRSIRFLLSLGLSTLVALSVLSIILAVLGVLIPRLYADAEEQNRTLSRAAATQIDGFLTNFSSKLGRLSDDIASRKRLSGAQLQSMLDTIAHAEKGIESLYVIDANERVIGVGLPKENRQLRGNQLGIDFSGRTFAHIARQTQRKIWSGTYLSSRGNIVVALALPLTIPGKESGEATTIKGVLIGEINLHEISRFAGLLSTSDNVLAIIVDSRGNVVGHPDAEWALRQENLKHLELLNDKNGNSPKTAQFQLDSVNYLGSTTPIPETGWTALIGQPTDKAFAIVRSTLFSLAAGSAIALIMAVIAALMASRRMMRQVEIFAAHMEAVANGNYYAKIPHSSIDEIESLSQHMQRMAASVLEREARLRESETNFRTLVESAPQGIALIGESGKFVLVNAAYTRLFGYELQEVPNITIWWEKACPDPTTRDEAVRRWQSQINSTITSETEQRFFKIRRADGQTRDIELIAEKLPDKRILITFSDITERKQDEASLQRAAKVFSHAREGIVITDAKCNIVEVNDAFSQITGYKHDEAIGKNLRMLKSTIEGSNSYFSIRKSLVQNGHWYGELWNKNRRGDLYAVLVDITAVLNTTGATQNYVVLFTDITQMKEYQRQLELTAHYDVLTGLPNRVLLADRLRQAMVQTLRRNRSLAVIYLDLDGFKLINDHHGHDKGDRLLLAVAKRMKEVLRDGDTISRIGGDEFVAVLVDLDNEPDCQPVLERLLQAAASPCVVDGHTLQVSASIGVTFYPLDSGDADQLMRHADQAMYQAKQSGKNCYYIFDVEHHTTTVNQLNVLENIRGALERNEFVLYYQPKVNMQNGTVIGAEALIRWQHPERGLLPPSDFLPFIESNAIGIELGEWVINTALAQSEVWRERDLHIPISVNIGVRQLLDSRFKERLQALLAAHPTIPRHHLELEILETGAMEDLQHVSELMHACRNMGVNFSLDDFGTGYSSLTYLSRLPANILKIDRSFIQGMLDDPKDLAIVSGVIGLASAFSRQVIAEGVETTAQGLQLLAIGCVLAQGNRIAKPMPANELPVWIETWEPDPAWFSETGLKNDLSLISA